MLGGVGVVLVGVRAVRVRCEVRWRVQLLRVRVLRAHRILVRVAREQLLVLRPRAFLGQRAPVQLVVRALGLSRVPRPLRFVVVCGERSAGALLAPAGLQLVVLVVVVALVVVLEVGLGQVLLLLLLMVVFMFMLLLLLLLLVLARAYWLVVVSLMLVLRLLLRLVPLLVTVVATLNQPAALSLVLPPRTVLAGSGSGRRTGRGGVWGRGQQVVWLAAVWLSRLLLGRVDCAAIVARQRLARVVSLCVCLCVWLRVVAQSGLVFLKEVLLVQLDQLLTWLLLLLKLQLVPKAQTEARIKLLLVLSAGQLLLVAGRLVLKVVLAVQRKLGRRVGHLAALLTSGPLPFPLLLDARAFQRVALS